MATENGARFRPADRNGIAAVIRDIEYDLDAEN
jgi:hypothetical protein